MVKRRQVRNSRAEMKMERTIKMKIKMEKKMKSQKSWEAQRILVLELAFC